MPRPVAILASCALSASLTLAAPVRYEAEASRFDPNAVAKTASASASGGFFVSMKDGDLAFSVEAPAAGFYSLWAGYAQPNDRAGKFQNLFVNGQSAGQIAFPYTTAFATVKISAKIRLRAGVNEISIRKSWGWVDLDFLEVRDYESLPFSIPAAPVDPNASVNARKLYGFLHERFGQRVISGFMTNSVMANDGKYTPLTLDNQEEAVWIKKASGKLPALMGLDFLHATGLNSDQDWHRGYTRATLALAAEMFAKGGIPVFCWHWMDPSLATEAFYTASSGNKPIAAFDLAKAFSDTTYAAFDTAGAAYKSLIRDMDAVAGQLKSLADKGVPVLWRPLHEASGRWFWWGTRGPKPCRALYRLMFDRFTRLHGLHNLIWVWTTDEAADAGEWYPGDDVVDIVGRDFYYYPRIADHGSLAASFEKVKEITGGRKLLALSENGSIPHPDSLQGDGAGWSFFMPWYGDYTMDGWAHDNTAADWKAILNHPYVITLDGMPGWDKYTPSASIATARPHDDAGFRVRQDWLETPTGIRTLQLYDMSGRLVSILRPLGGGRFSRYGIAPGVYQARAHGADGRIKSAPLALFAP